MNENQGSQKTDDHLAALVRWLEQDGHFMAYVLKQYQTLERLTEDELQAKLQVGSASVIRLALCKRPDIQSEDAQVQIEQIAHLTGIQAGLIINLLTQVANLESLTRLPDVEAKPNVSRPATSPKTSTNAT